MQEKCLQYKHFFGNIYYLCGKPKFNKNRMKKKILEALKAKFEGVSEAILDRIATKLAKTATTDEQVTTAVEGVTLQQVIESYGDSRATEAQQTAVRNYEAKHNLENGKPKKPAGDEPDNGNATENSGENAPAWVKTLTDRLDRLEASRTAESRKQQLGKVIDRLPENLRKAYERLPLDGYSDEQFSTVLGEITTEVEGIAGETAAKGGVFGKPSVANGTNNQQSLTEAQLKAISHREGVPAQGENPF